MRSERSPWVEVAGLLAVPLALIGVYALVPRPYQQELVLAHPEPALHAFWTTALVHHPSPGATHLLGNVVGYLSVTIPCWLLYTFREHRAGFWVRFLVIIGLAPVVTSLGTVIAVDAAGASGVEAIIGYSGVVSAINGLLILSIVNVFETEQELGLTLLSTGVYGSVLVGVLGLVTGRPTILTVGAIGLVGTYLGTRIDLVAGLEDLRRWAAANRPLATRLEAAIVLSVVGFVTALPAVTVAESGPITNLAAHGTGIAFGMIVELGGRVIFN